MHYIYLNQFDTEPLYRQLKSSIKQAIITGVLSHLDPLPSEHDLVEMFSISSTVVKKAYLALEEDNLISRIQGKGTFVDYPKAVIVHHPFSYFFHEDPFSTSTQALIQTTRNPFLLDTFPTQTNLLHVKQTIHVHHELLGVQDTVLPYMHRSSLLHADRHFHLKSFIQTHLTHHEPFTISSRMTLAPSNAYQARVLSIDVGSPLVIFHSTMRYNEDIIAMGKTYFRGDKTLVQWEGRL
jgi:DNA-binding GntR family transcriptional regulator